MRERVVDFSKPYMTTGIRILAKKPEHTYISVSFLTPFSWATWIVIIVATVLVSRWLLMQGLTSVTKHSLLALVAIMNQDIVLNIY